MRNALFVLAILGFIGLLCISAVVVILGLTMPRWPDRLEGVRLEPDLPVLHEDEVRDDNAYYHFRSLQLSFDSEQAAAYENLTTYRSPEDDCSELLAFAAQHTDAVALGRRAAACPRGQVATMESYDDTLEYLGPIRTVTRVLDVLAWQAARTQRWQDMINLHGDMLRLASCVETGGPLISRLVAMSCRQQAVESMVAATIAFPVPVPVRQQEVQILASAEDSRFPFAETVRFEYHAMRNDIAALYDDPASLGEIAQGDAMALQKAQGYLRALGSSKSRTLAHLDAFFSHVIQAAELSYDRKRYASINYDIEALQRPRYMMPINDPIGKVMLSLFMPELASPHERVVAETTLLRLAAVALAVQAYAREEGQLPDSLDVLVPRFLPEVPLDPFDREGGAVRYRREAGAWIIYGVGPNHLDDGAAYDYYEQISALRPVAERRIDVDIVLRSDRYERRRQDTGPEDSKP